MPNDTASQKAYLAETFRNAEHAGLRVALKGRLVVLGLLGVFLVSSRIQNPDHALEPASESPASPSSASFSSCFSEPIAIFTPTAGTIANAHRRSAVRDGEAA